MDLSLARREGQAGSVGERPGPLYFGQSEAFRVEGPRVRLLARRIEHLRVM